MTDIKRISDMLTSGCPKLVVNKNGELCGASKQLGSFLNAAPESIKTIFDLTDTPSDFLGEGERNVHIKGITQAVKIQVEPLDEEHFCVGFTDLCSMKCRKLDLMESVYQSLICGVMLFSFEENPRIINLNNMALSILGCPNGKNADLMINRDIYLPVFLGDIEYTQRKIRECMDGGNDVEFENRIRRLDGSIGWIRGLLRKITYRDSTAVQCSFIDITEQKENDERLKENDERFSAAITQAGIKVWEYNPKKGTLLFCNNDNADDGAGMLPISEESMPEYKRIHKEIDEGAPYASCIVSLDTDSVPQPWCRITYKSCYDKDGKVSKAIGISEDVTEHKFIEEKYLKELEFMHSITNAVLSVCRVNVTKNRVEAYRPDETIAIDYTDGMRYDVFIERIISNVENKYERENAMQVLSREAILACFKRGEWHAKAVYRRRKNNGSFYWIEAALHLTREPETGDIIAFAYGRDCTYLSIGATQSERMLMHFKRAADSAYYYVMSLDYLTMTYDLIHLSDKTVGTNIPMSGEIPEFITLADELYGEVFTEMAQTISSYDKLIEAIGENGEITFELYSNSGYGFHWFEYRIIRASDNPDEKLFLCLTSIVDSKKRKEDILRRALEKASVARKAKRDFISNMSRGIRTPLSGITGMLELMKQRPELEKDEFLQNALASANQLTYLMSDILDITALLNGHITLQESVLAKDDFDGFIRSVVQPFADEKKIIFTTSYTSESYPDIICDARRLEQIIVNLLTNAVKFTQNGGSVMFGAVTEKCNNDSISIDFIISDTGIGMTDEFLEHAFEPFDREDRTGNHGGTGLGLAIVQQLTELMGGTVSIDSAPNRGTTITVHINFRTAAANDIRNRARFLTPQSRVLPSLAGKHVLVVEDNNLNMEIAEHHLRALHLIVDKAANGFEAIQAFENSYFGYYDIIFMDVVMPKCDGLTATRTIRLLNRDDAKTIPIVAMTANAFPEDERKSYESGMNYHLSKPFHPEDIKEILLREFGK